MEIKIAVSDKKNTITLSCDDNNIISDVVNLLVEKQLIQPGKNMYSDRLNINLDTKQSFRSNLIQTGDIIYVN